MIVCNLRLSIYLIAAPGRVRDGCASAQVAGGGAAAMDAGAELLPAHGYSTLRGYSREHRWVPITLLTCMHMNSGHAPFTCTLHAWSPLTACQQPLRPLPLPRRPHAGHRSSSRAPCCRPRPLPPPPACRHRVSQLLAAVAAPPAAEAAAVGQLEGPTCRRCTIRALPGPVAELLSDLLLGLGAQVP